MAQLEIASFERTGSELLLRFNSEADAKRMEAALGVAFPEEPSPEPGPESTQPSQSVSTHMKSEWGDGFVLEVFVTNEGQEACSLQLPMSMEANIENVWGGTFKQAGSNVLITSDKPIDSGETWSFTLKAAGTNHGFSILQPIQAEEEVAPTEPPKPITQPAPQDAPGTLVYAPVITSSVSVDENIRGLGGVHDGGWDWENIQVIDEPDGPCLRTHMGAGLYVGDKGKCRGAGFDTRTLKATHAVLEYDLRFKPGFDPVKGGKLPGLMGGDSPSGHKEADNGFTARMMWRRDAEGELYLYYPDQKQSHGDSIGRGEFRFYTTGEWQRIKQEVRLNDVGRSNGFIRVWFKDFLVIEATGLRLRTKDSVLIEGIMHTIFFGGGDRSWSATRDEWVDTRNFRIYTP